MAQTKRKRRRKHRGTQAGTIETPGRTGRSRAPAASSGKKGTATSARGSAKAARPHRLDKPPTWRGSLNRSAVMAAIVVLFLGLTQKNWAAAVLLGVVAVAIYVPITYYTDRAIYRRRQRQKQKGTR
jgi:phosphatidylglycerophosphate synthase